MNAFTYDHGTLACDGVPLSAIAEATGTPVYVYSAAAIRAAYTGLDSAFAAYPHRIHYALKANSTLAIARLLHDMGSGVDANSVGEIETALRAGFEPTDMVFSGVGKRADELQRAVSLGVHAINVESRGEAERLAAIAQQAGVRARVAVRVNPDVDAGSHPYITTGLSASKFGVPAEATRDLCRFIAATGSLHLTGLHVHVGSQVMTPQPLTAAAAALAHLALALRADGIALEHLDVGGGLGISYTDDDGGVSAAEYANEILRIIRDTGLRLLLEPGRVVAARAGVVLSRVVEVKPRAGGTRFAIIDAGMTELIRPALYGAYHRIQPVTPSAGADECYEVVGPLCETSDSYGGTRMLPSLAVGDLLAVRDAGAYGSVMASTYNRRPLAPEVLVENGTWRIIRRRQTIDDILALEA